MAHISDLIARDIEQYLESHERKGMLRFITCGSVDDGKSTLIGRLLYEAKALFEDQLAQLEADSRRVGTQGGATYGGAALPSTSQIYYRITARVTGPRNTVSYVQVMVN